MKSQPPCFGCTNREIGCHGKCEKYASFKRESDEKKAYLREELGNPFRGCQRLSEHRVYLLSHKFYNGARELVKEGGGKS